MSNYLTTFQKFKQNEGGYNSPFGGSGETYKGIDRLFHATWPGWRTIDAYKSKYGTPKREAVIDDPVLDMAVADFYREYLNRMVDPEKIVNQTLADFVCDFLVHKQYDAIKVINSVAATTIHAAAMNVVLQTNATSITDSVLFVMNAVPYIYYVYLLDARRKYYANPALFGSKLKFSPALIAAFLNRVNKFPNQA